MSTEWEKQLFYCKERGFRVTGRDCDQYFQNGNGQQCPADCQLRNKKMTDMAVALIIPVDPDVRQKTCKVCEQEKQINDFPKNARSKDGHLNTCAVCFGERISKSHSKKTEEEIKPKPKESKPAKKNIVIGVDFSKYPVIYESLMESAENDFRTPDMQVVAILDRVFKAVEK